MTIGCPWWSEEKLREKYIGEELTIPEIADEWGTALGTIGDALEKHNIETRGPEDYAAPGVGLYQNRAGYEAWVDDEHTVLVHRLLVALNHDISELDGMHVHHRNGIPWDNRPANLDVLSPQDHANRHAEERNCKQPRRDDFGGFLPE